MRLFDLSGEILALEADLEREGLSEEQRDALVEAWLEAQGAAAEKLDHFAAWIECTEAMAEQRRFQADRMRALARADEQRAKRGKALLEAYFERHGLTQFKTARFTLTRQRNGGPRPLIVDVLPGALPPEFQVTAISANTEALRQALEAIEAQEQALQGRFESGEIDEESLIAELAMIERIPGVRLGERGYSLRIR